MRRFLPPALLTVALILSACSAAFPLDRTPPQPAPVSTESASSSNDSATRIDRQGAVTVEVTPLNLDAPADTLEFDVVMDTHSVDLSMDLAALATLTADTGVTVQAATWDAPRASRGRQTYLSRAERWQVHFPKREQTHTHYHQC